MIDMGDDDRDITEKLQGSYDLAMESCTSELMPYEYLIKAKNEILALRARVDKQNARLREQWEWPTKHGTFRLVAFGFLFGSAAAVLIVFLMAFTLQFKVMTWASHAAYCAQNGAELERLRP
jgi:hypothetical protein